MFLFLIFSRGKSFRVDYKDLSVVRSFSPDIPLLPLTATAPPQTICLLQESLCMVSYKVVKVYPDRKNIYLNKHYRLDTCYSYQSYDRILKPIAYELLEKQKKCPMTVIYTKLKYCGYAYQLFSEIIGEHQYIDGKVHPYWRLFAQFHAPQTDRMKAEILREIKEETSHIRVIFATSALGMGVDAPGITLVIHIGPPSNIESYLQEIGRAGRRGSETTADLYFCNSDITSTKVTAGRIDPSMVGYCQNKSQCQRKLIMAYFGFHDIPAHGRCCCICDASFGKKVEEESARKQICAITTENFEKLSHELRKYAQSVEKEASEDEYCLFGQTSSTCILPTVIENILCNVELIKSEMDLLSDFGIWNQNNSSHIYALIFKYSSQ